MNYRSLFLSVVNCLLSLALHAQTQGVTKSFQFSIQSELQGYNTETGEFWRLYTSGKKSFKIELSPTELDAINRQINPELFNSFPEEFKPNGAERIITTPCFHYKITARWEGVEKSVKYSDCESNSAMEAAAKPFLQLYNQVWNLIEKNEFVEQIPESDIYWE